MIVTAVLLTLIGALTVTAQDGYRLSPVCLEPQQVGPCRARRERYFYNSKSQQCERFFWGGCRPNGNNFQTLSQCELTCRHPSGLGGCTYNNNVYANGANIPTSNPCEHCSCNNGRVNCAIQDCARPPCSNPTRIPGQCCPVCQTTGSCTYNNNVYANGATIPTSNPCEFCTCEDGWVICALASCAPPPCSNPTQVPGQCCPVCQTTGGPGSCFHNNNWYANGARIPTSDPCEHCSCFSGQVNCAIQDCARPPCSNPTRIPGQCCPVCNNIGFDDLALASKVKRAAGFPQLRCPQFMPPPEGFKCEKYDRRCSDTGSDKCPKGKVCCNMPCGTACY